MADWRLKNQRVTHGKLFNELRERYRNRQRGFTRIHLFGHRKGDHAPTAVVELVDHPQDLKSSLTATRVGRELAMRAIEKSDSSVIQWRLGCSKGTREQEASQSSEDDSGSSTPYPQLPVSLLSGRLQRDVTKAIRPAEHSPMRTEQRNVFQSIVQNSFDQVLGVQTLGEARPDRIKTEQLSSASEMSNFKPEIFTPPRVGYSVKAGGQPLLRRQLSRTKSIPEADEQDADIFQSDDGWVDEDRVRTSPLTRAKGHQRRTRGSPKFLGRKAATSSFARLQ